MNIPLDNLYNFVEGVAEIPAVFYLFCPHGSRKISDLKLSNPYSLEDTLVAPRVICHDQEPLNYHYYSDQQPEMQELRCNVDAQFQEVCGIEKWLWLDNNNLKLAIYNIGGIDVRDQAVLLHSELNSKDLDLYTSNGYVGAFWWSHAMIAKDWYRFAEHDKRLMQPRTPSVPFLIYSRGFTREREYRLKFIELLVKGNLLEKSQISMLHNEDGHNVHSYQMHNNEFVVNDTTVYDCVPECQVLAAASAGYDVNDIVNTCVNVVLETQYHGSKIHLTEKILRPIACGQPFILAAAPQSLALLRYYGFDTYQGLIDESYDNETDSVQRLEKIINAMQKLSSMSTQQWVQWNQQAQVIARRNQQRFFSQEFQQQILDQLSVNLNSALKRSAKTTGYYWQYNRKMIRKNKPTNWKSYLYRDNERFKAQHLRMLRGIN